jgi:hypothetical protein
MRGLFAVSAVTRLALTSISASNEHDHPRRQGLLDVDQQLGE